MIVSECKCCARNFITIPNQHHESSLYNNNENKKLELKKSKAWTNISVTFFVRHIHSKDNEIQCKIVSVLNE